MDMELTYVCPACGGKSRLEAELIMDAAAIRCPLCGKTSGNMAAPASAAAAQAGLGFSPDTMLNGEQRQAACYDGPADGIMLLAGAGCGKTRTMVARALYLMKEKGVSPSKIAMLTFTRRAAAEIEQRVERELPGCSGRMFMGTFHRFCLNLLHRHPESFNLADAKIMDRSDQEIALRRIRSSLHSATVGRIGRNEGIVPKESGMIGVFSYVNNRRCTIDDYYARFEPQSEETPQLMKDALGQYIEYKMENGYLDFDDILLRTAEAMERDPGLVAYVRKWLDYALVDEMQDTSPVQWDILRAIYPGVRLFCVGDDAQSIYSFRGADFDSVHHFCDILPNSIKLKLTENYRSTQAILDAANALMDDSRLDYGKDLRAHSGERGTPPQLLSFDREETEASRITRMIAGRLHSGVRPEEIMVLLRSMMHGRMLEHGLRSYGIPYRVIGGMSFLQASHVKDVVAMLQALSTPRSELAWMRFLPLLPGIGARGAEKLYSPEEDGALDRREFLTRMGLRLARKCPEAARFLARDFELDATPDRMLRQIIDFCAETGLLEKRYDKWQERSRDLEVLAEIAAQYKTAASFLEAFLLDPDAEVSAAGKDGGGGRVTLITVHSAKGTEADVCFVLRVQPGSYPHYKSLDEAQNEEDRRVLYVAMTRARKELFLTEVNDCRSFYARNVSGQSFLSRRVRERLAQPRSTGGYSYNDL